MVKVPPPLFVVAFALAVVTLNTLVPSKVNVPFVTLPPVVEALSSKEVEEFIDDTYAPAGIPVPLTGSPGYNHKSRL